MTLKTYSRSVKTEQVTEAYQFWLSNGRRDKYLLALDEIWDTDEWIEEQRAKMDRDIDQDMLKFLQRSNSFLL